MCFHLFVSPKSETFPPAWLSSWSHSPRPTHIFFYSLVFAFQALCQLFFPRLPTWLLTLSFMIKSENDAFRLFSRLSQQTRLRGCVSSCFSFTRFYFYFALRLASQSFTAFSSADNLFLQKNCRSNRQKRIIFSPPIHGWWKLGVRDCTPGCRTSAGGTSLLCSPTSAAVVSPISPGVFPKGVRELNIWQRARRGVTQLTCAWFYFHMNFIKSITQWAHQNFFFEWLFFSLSYSIEQPRQYLGI